jgi:DNA-binding transcriptional LysR family regulator
MYRNLDLAALRSLVAIADTGGVTRAAAKLHLTQSAVSMQIKRLETAIGHRLIERAGRSIAITRNGELLLSYGRRILSLNEEAWNRLTDDSYEGKISMGVPHDIIRPHLPVILRNFAAAFPRIDVRLITSGTSTLKELLAKSDIDLILTTEQTPTGDAELLRDVPLKWYCGAGAGIWAKRPLPLANEPSCAFRPIATDALGHADISWDAPFTAKEWREYAAFVSAGLAVVCLMEGTNLMDWVEVPAQAKLPTLPNFGIYMYFNEHGNTALASHMASFIRDEFYRQHETLLQRRSA